MMHEQLTGEVIGSAMKVLNTLRPGLDEKLYENALTKELGKRGHRCVQQKSFPVTYDHEAIGILIPDLIIDDIVLVET